MGAFRLTEVLFWGGEGGGLVSLSQRKTQRDLTYEQASGGLVAGGRGKRGTVRLFGEDCFVSLTASS